MTTGSEAGRCRELWLHLGGIWGIPEASLPIDRHISTEMKIWMTRAARWNWKPTAVIKLCSTLNYELGKCIGASLFGGCAFYWILASMPGLKGSIKHRHMRYFKYWIKLNLVYWFPKLKEPSSSSTYEPSTYKSTTYEPSTYKSTYATTTYEVKISKLSYDLWKKILSNLSF